MKKIRKPISVLLTFVMLFSVFASISITSASAVTPLGCVKQNDDQWKNYIYGTGSLYNTGCGIFSLVNAVGYLTGQRMSVTEAAEWAHSINAFNVTGAEGTYRTVLYPRVEEKYGEQYGFTVDCSTGTGYWEGSASITLKNHLSNGGVAIGHVPGHFIAVVGYNSANNTFHVYDSYATSGRGTNTNGGDVWVTQARFATGQLCLDWFCLLSSTGDTSKPNAPVTRYPTGDYMTSSYLNMHSIASASGDILTTIPSGTRVPVTKISGEWGYTTYNGKSGYIRLSYSSRVGDLTSSALYTVGVYKTTGNLNMRSSASTAGSVLQVIPKGTSLNITSISGNWGYTTYNGKSGYVYLFYATRTGDLPYTIGVYQLTGNLNMRDAPSASGNIVATLSNGTIVAVTKVTDGWGYINYNGKSGYINLSYASYKSDLTGVYQISGGLNVRDIPSADGKIVTTLSDGATVNVTKVANNGWGYITYNGKSGYINLSYVTRIGDLPTAPYPVGIYKTTGYVNMRATGSVSGTLVDAIPIDTIVFVTYVTETGWGLTSYNGNEGYFNLYYAKHIGELPASADCTPGIYTNKTDINMRSCSSYTSDSVAIIPANSSFVVTKVSSGWGYTEYNGNVGWVNLGYATYVGALEDSPGTKPEYPEGWENVESIKVIKLPSAKFAAGTEYDLNYCLNGMEVEVTYYDGSKESYTCERFDEFSSKFNVSADCIKHNMFLIPDSGENEITVSYGKKSTRFSVTGLAVEKIEIISPPARNKFILGHEYDIHNYLDKMEMKVYYSDGTDILYSFEENTELFNYELAFSGDCFDNATDYMIPTAGENKITVIHSGKTAQFTVYGLGVESIEIIKTPDKTEFLTDEEYSIYDYLYGTEVKIVYSDGTQSVYDYADNIELFKNELVISGDCLDENGSFIPEKGENVITVTYGGKSADFVINGLDIESIEIAKSPDKKFVAGAEYEFINCIYDLEVRVNYTESESKTFNFKDDMDFFSEVEFFGPAVDIYGKLTPTLGENVITVNYFGKTAQFTITALDIERIEVVSLPEKEYIADTAYSIYDVIYGMEIKVAYSDNTSETYTYGLSDEDNWLFFGYELKFSGNCMDEYGKVMTPVYGDNVIYAHCGDKSTSFTVKATPRLGDVNLDGEIDILDVTCIQKYRADLIALNEEELLYADVNGDGDVTIRDATLIQMFIANKITEF